MKRKIGIISTLIVMILVVILTVLLTNKKEKKPLNFTTNGSSIAYMYEQTEGNYVLGDSTGWSNGNYVLDIKDSSCNNQKNPDDIIDWNPSSNSVLLKANENVNCTLYFDKVTPGQTYTAEDFFTTFAKNGGLSGQGNLLQHTTSLPNSAGDDGYRYSGNNPNNFICFGPGSENYNNGTSIKCPDGNLYRIIGYVPVELSDNKKENRIKVIKSEYATHEDLGKEKADGTRPFSSTYEKLKRVKAESVESFKWNASSNNTWVSSTLYRDLNNGFTKKLGDNWTDKIENVKWNVAGHNTSDVTAKAMYDIENNDTQGTKTKVSAKIGLMYPSDYGFASSENNWTIALRYYNTDENRENNWLFNAVYEWTIFRSSVYTFNAVGVNNPGSVLENNVVNACGVRPVFYLNSSVTLSGGDGIDGSQSKPFKVS